MACESSEAERNLIALFATGDELKRDDDFMRALLLEMQDSDQWVIPMPLFMNGGADILNRHFHARLLADAGLLEASGQRMDMFRITSQGHDFANAIRSDGLWSDVKRTTGRAAGYSVKMLADVASALVRAKIKEATGLDF